ncbi:inorganic phosphate transporter 1-4 [Spatholobus suberectus]|nr:inorganic phosphate transporter 1-4 [Spatholobus suberectus]
MGTKVQNLPGYYSMRDLNEESSSCGWPLFYGDKSLTNGQYYNNYLPSSTTEACSVYDKDVVKRMMLEHEAIFKNQVNELHRLYRIQEDLMNEFKRKELHRNQIPVEASFSTGPMKSQVTTEDGQKWHISGFPVGNSTCAKTSVSGVDGIHSPLGSMKGISKQTSPFPSPNGCSSKDLEVLESRPSKVRRKMFDLQLPADEYIDPEESEKLSDEKTSDPSFFLPDRSCKNRKEGDAKLFCGNGGNTEQSLRRRNGLADLNEPVQVEDTFNAPYVHLLSHNPCQGATECSDLSAAAKQKSQFFGLSREQLLNSHHGTDSWARNNGYLENNGSGKGWYPSVAEAGQAKSNTQPVPQVLKLEKSPLPSQTIQDALSKVCEPASDYLNGRNKADMWREKTVSDLHIGERNHEYSINKHPESAVPLHRPGLFAAAPSSDLSKSWSHSASSWEMATSSLSRKLMSIQTPPCLNASGALSRSSQSHQSNGILEDNWPMNINSKPNPGYRCDVPIQNGFYPGSSSGSKAPSTNFSSISYDYLNHNNDCKIIPYHFINNGSSKSCKGSNSNFNDMKSGKDIDLNVLLPNGSSNNLVPQSGFGIMDGEQKNEDRHAVLPWLRGKTTCKNEVQNTAGESSLFHAASLSNKDETGKGPNGKFMHNLTSVWCSNNIEPRRMEVNESSSNKKILGVPIFDMPHISPKKELSSITSPSVSDPNPSDVEAAENKKKRILDINLPCDSAVFELDKEAFTETAVSKTRSPTTEADSRNQIDLNLSMSEDEGSFTTIPSDNIKMKAEIDLEAPAVPETEEDAVPEEKQLETSLASPQVPQETVEQPKDDELMTTAAEAIVVLSSLSCDQVDGVISTSPSESPKVDLLSWFADVVSSCKDNLEGKCDILREKDGEDNEERSSEGMDYFEAMTLKMPETKEEDYMPKPLVPENFKVEETTTLLPTRTRKGPARRGRQRRDFQRDILPGLASLSRHEVTEDLQTFGGLMRATGYSWHSGLTRRSSSRNGSGRGRRRAQVTPSSPTPAPTNETSTRLMQQLNNIEVGLEDRSLTGWGKTTRRPRRQRCPAGNPALIPLT